jgi:organic hydroperoxide reductase OsmC/OhrA
MRTQEQTNLTTYSDRITNTLYSTKVTAIGGRHGQIRSEDGLLDMKLALPRHSNAIRGNVEVGTTVSTR